MGHADAQFYLGLLYQNGQGGALNYTIARKWYQKAADQGHLGSKAQLIALTLLQSSAKEGLNASKEQAMREKVNDGIEKELLDKANGGDVRAQFNLAVIYEYGRHVQQNYRLAAYWYQKAAEQGYVTAQFCLGLLYINAQGVTQDYTIAVGWFQKAAAQKGSVLGHADAQFNLALLYLNGRGVIRDCTLAVEWFLKAALQGNVGAQLNIAMLFQNGLGVVKDLQTAIDWYKRAAEQGSVDALFNLGTLYENWQESDQHYRLAVEWYRKAADQKHIEAQYKLGLLYGKGLGVTQDFTIAREWIEKAANRGNAEAQFALGFIYNNAKGVARNYEIAHRWFQRAAVLGNAAAQYMLGVHYENGYWVSINNRTACEWYQKAAAQGYELAQAQLKFLTERQSRRSVLSAPTRNTQPRFLLKMRTTVQNDVQPNADFAQTTEKEKHVHLGEKTEPPKRHAIDAKQITDLTVNIPEKIIEQTGATIILTQEQIAFLSSLQSSGLQPATLHQVQALFKQNPLLPEEIRAFTTWTKITNASIAQIETKLSETNRILGQDPQTQSELAYINKKPKLKNYLVRLRREFCCFVTCYFLAPAGIFKLNENKKDIAISAIGSIPMAGCFLKILTAGLSLANNKYRSYQINHLSDLFTAPDHIARVASDFARQFTLIREEKIEQQREVKHEGLDKIKGFFQMVKEMLEQQWNDLATSDRTGVTLFPEDKLAALDCAYLLQQVLSGDAKINKAQDLVNQFIVAINGESYKPRNFTETTEGAQKSQVQTMVTVMSSTPQSASPNNFDLLILAERLQAQEEKSRAQEEKFKLQEAEAKALKERIAEQEAKYKEDLARAEKERQTQETKMRLELERHKAEQFDKTKSDLEAEANALKEKIAEQEVKHKESLARAERERQLQEAKMLAQFEQHRAEQVEKLAQLAQRDELERLRTQLVQQEQDKEVQAEKLAQLEREKQRQARKLAQLEDSQQDTASRAVVARLEKQMKSLEQVTGSGGGGQQQLLNDGHASGTVAADVLVDIQRGQDRLEEQVTFLSSALEQVRSHVGVEVCIPSKEERTDESFARLVALNDKKTEGDGSDRDVKEEQRKEFMKLGVAILAQGVKAKPAK